MQILSIKSLFLPLIIGKSAFSFILTPNLLVRFDNKELHAFIEQTAWGAWSVKHHASDMHKVLKWSSYSGSFEDFIKNYAVNIDVTSTIKGFDDSHSQSFNGILANKKINDYFKDDKKSLTITLINDFYRREFITGGTQAKTMIYSLADDDYLYMYSEVWAGGGGASFNNQHMIAELNINSIKFIYS